MGQRVELDIPSQLRFLSDPDKIYDVRIRRVNTGFVKLFSQNRIPVDSRVQILFNGQTIIAQVAYCTASGEGYSVGASFGETGFVRRELRVPVHLPAMLTLPESPNPVKIRVVDMSASGLGLAVPMEIPVGTGVAVDLEHGTVFGEIRYCIQSSGYYRAGLALEEFIPVDSNGKTESSLLSVLNKANDQDNGLLGNVRQTVLAKLRLNKVH